MADDEMTIPVDEQAPDDYALDPIQKTAATMALVDRMKQEEDLLGQDYRAPSTPAQVPAQRPAMPAVQPQMSPQASPAPQPMPGPSMAQPAPTAPLAPSPAAPAMAGPPQQPQMPIPRPAVAPPSSTGNTLGPNMWRHASSTAPDLEGMDAQRKFEAEKMYRFYTANGMSPADAMAKVGPALFPQTKPVQPKLQNIGGVGYVMDSSGRLVQMTPEKAVKPPMAPKLTDVQKSYLSSELASLKTAENVAQSKIANGSTDEAAQARKDLADIRKQRTDLFGKLGLTQPATTGTGTTPPPAAPKAAIKAPAKGKSNAEDKLNRAQALRKEHPDWSKKQIIDAVTQELG